MSTSNEDSQEVVSNTMPDCVEKIANLRAPSHFKLYETHIFRLDKSLLFKRKIKFKFVFYSRNEASGKWERGQESTHLVERNNFTDKKGMYAISNHHEV